MNVIDRIGPRAICIVTTARYDVTHLENIYEAYKRAQEPKKIVLLPVEQLDVYKEPGRSMALEEAVKWFDEYLKHLRRTHRLHWDGAARSHRRRRRVAVAGAGW
jgi:hypothetical protein